MQLQLTRPAIIGCFPIPFLRRRRENSSGAQEKDVARPHLRCCSLSQRALPLEASSASLPGRRRLGVSATGSRMGRQTEAKRPDTGSTMEKDEKQDEKAQVSHSARSSSALPLPILASQALPPPSGPARPKMARFRKDPTVRGPDPRDRNWLKDTLMPLLRRFTAASTGSPSDGMGNEGSESSASVTRFLAQQKEIRDELDEDKSFVTDEVVVKGDLNGIAAAAWRAAGTQTGTETGGKVSSSGSNVAASLNSGGLTKRLRREGSSTNTVWHLLRWRAWPYVIDYLAPRFENDERELEFQKSRWYTNKKPLAFFAIYIVLNWVLYLIGNHADTLYQKATYYSAFTLFSCGLPFLVWFDWPSRGRFYQAFFQVWLVIASFYAGWLETIEWEVCGFYSKGYADGQPCGGKDFLAMLLYPTLVPALALLIAGSRFYFIVGQIVELVLLFVFVVPSHPSIARNIVNFILLSAFVDWLSWQQERNARHAYMLNSSLKHAYRAQQKLQLAESAAQNSKRRLTSYIFHEVRVPLNTAMLAFQNLQANSAFKEDRLDSDATEIHALEGSLAMMQQVLNDVLDLQRLDSGRFEANYQPFPLHRAINALLGGIRVATTAKKLSFEADLDPRIDGLVSELPEYDGAGLKDLWVVGDELRLRQVISNLASNAVKFTPHGNGRIRVKTELLAPLAGARQEGDQMPPDTIVFRFEIQDGGPGIRPSDLANARLFSPFHQTVASRLTTTKGSGLGLALVKQIITLSGGRLGVKSATGQGATLWFELGLRIATPDEVSRERESQHGPLATPPDLPSAENRLAQEILKAVGHSPVDMLQTRPSDLSISTESAISEVPLPSFDTSAETIESSRPLLTTHNTAPAAPPLRLDIPPATVTPVAAVPLRVLVVDDDGLTRKLMTRMLTRLGCEVDSLDDGQAFLDRLLGKTDGSTGPAFYDMVTLDNQMPLSGEIAIRQLRQAGRTDFVVGATGNALKEDQQSYLGAGVDRILTKPLLQKDLKLMLLEAERRKSAATEDVISVEPR